jgi:hypothetical protein
MKFFGDSRIAQFVEKYHPVGAALIIGAIYSLKYTGHTDLYNKFTDISYATTMKREAGAAEHHLKGWDDAYFVFFFFQVVTVVRFLYCNLILKVCSRIQ